MQAVSGLLRRTVAGLLVVGAVGMGVYVFGGDAVKTMARLTRELHERRATNAALASQNRAMRIEVDALRNDPLVIEQVAREELSLVAERDVIVLFSPDDGRSRRVQVQTHSTPPKLFAIGAPR